MLFLLGLYYLFRSSYIIVIFDNFSSVCHCFYLWAPECHNFHFRLRSTCFSIGNCARLRKGWISSFLSIYIIMYKHMYTYIYTIYIQIHVYSYEYIHRRYLYPHILYLTIVFKTHWILPTFNIFGYYLKFYLV